MTPGVASFLHALQAVAAHPEKAEEEVRPRSRATARLELCRIESRIGEDRLAFNHGHFFDQWERRMKIEEASRP